MAEQMGGTQQAWQQAQQPWHYAFDYLHKQDQLPAEALLAPLDLLAALNALERATLEAERRVEKDTADHFRLFTAQVRTLIAGAQVVMDEPYLAAAQGQAVLEYLHGIERILDVLERLLNAKAIRPQDPIRPQIELELEKLGTSSLLRHHQRLDALRSQQFGFRSYIWRTAGDDRVRGAHAANAGQIFRWDDPPPTGHPGEDYNCRCRAVPVRDGAGEPSLTIEERLRQEAIEPVYPELIILAVGRIGNIINGLRNLARRIPIAKPRSPKDILNPNGRPIGERGNRSDVRVIRGGRRVAEELFDELTEGGTPEKPQGYPGEGKRLPNGDWVGYRPKSRHGEPAIDVKVKDFPYSKIKFPD